MGNSLCPVIDVDSAARFIRTMVPDWEWLLKHIESEDGYIRFPPQLSRMISNLKMEHYPELYENEASIGQMMLRAFLDLEEIKTLDAELTALAPDERGRHVENTIGDMKDVFEAVDFPKTPAAEREAAAAFQAMSEAEQKEAISFWQCFMMGFFAYFYQSLSVMVHGEKLTSLVAQAKAGNDKAFAKAVQIDKRILHGIPYFKQHFAAANMEGKRKFAEDVAAHMQRPPYKGKIRHKSLFLAFAYLDMAGLLDVMKHKEILDLCDEAGVGGYANRIEDVKNLSKRLAEFRTFRQRGLILSTP